MIRLLSRAAAAVPDQVAVVSPEGSPTYAELLHDAHQIAAAFADLSPVSADLSPVSLAGVRRVAIVEPDAAWVLRLLAGAAVAGVEACQYQPDTPAGELLPQLAAFGHTVVLTRRPDLLDLADPSPVFIDLSPMLKLATGQLKLATGQQELATGQQELATGRVLIRTTGTTGEPKAARHDWQVLEQTVAQVRPRSNQRWLLAYGPQQFAGIQVLQHVIASQATLVAPFPRQPRDGLEALLTQEVTCVSATPTYWRFLLTEARSRGVQLPDLEQITLGGEAIPPDLLDELKKAFPTARISQVYASTEFGSIVSVGDGRAGFSVDKLFSDVNPDAHLKVVDGELWVRRTPGMLGYAGPPSGRPAKWSPEPPERRTSRERSCEEVAATAETQDVPTDDEWKPTGDLVEVVGDRVEFRGRDSDVINVGGVKVHPLPVENAITALDGVALARVFGRANKLTGAIVAAEVVAADGADEEDVRRAIKAAVADLPRAWHPRSITFVEAIATRGEKTVRRMEQ